MKIVIYSYCKAFGETNKADMLTAYLQAKGLECKHFGIKEVDAIQTVDYADWLILFYSFPYEEWNLKIIPLAQGVGARILLYTGGTMGYAESIQREYPAIYRIFEQMENLLSFLESDAQLEESHTTNLLQVAQPLTANREDLRRKGLRHALINTLYGFPSQRYENGAVRREPVHIIDELCDLSVRYGVQGVHFDDVYLDDPPGGAAYVKKLFACKCAARFPMVFSANFSNAYILSLKASEEEQLRQTGLYRAYLDLHQTRNLAAADLRPVDSIQCAQAVAKWRKIGVDLYYHFYMFHPFTTLSDFRSSMDFLRDSRICFLSLAAARFNPLRGSQLYTHCREHGLAAEKRGVVEKFAFADPQAAQLYSRVTGVYQDLSRRGYQEGDAFHEMLHYIGAMAVQMEDTVLAEEIGWWLDRLNICREMLSEACYEYLCRLVALVMDGWNDCIADCLYKDYIPALIESGRQLAQIKKQLFYEMRRLCTPDRRWLLDCL